MLAVLNRRREPLSKTTIIVCFYVPAILFGVIAVVFGLLGIGRITVQQYFTVYQFIVIGCGVIFFALCFTNFGADIIVEVMRKRRALSVLPYILFLMMLGMALPRIFGFI
jgi:hypothetical protein